MPLPDNHRQPPLVSIVALAFSAATTIIESLDSFAAQTYSRLELILCDDGSTDTTVALAEEWIAKRGARFERVEFVRHPTNVGIVRNHAGGLARCRGKWIKSIACDDLLAPAAIATFVERAQATGAEWLMAQCRRFAQHDGQREDLGDLIDSASAALLAQADSAKLREAMLHGNFVPAPGVFCARAMLEECGGLDLRFHHLDDWPLWIRLLEMGRVPEWIALPLISYRITADTASQRTARMAVPPLLFADELRFTTLYLRYRLPRWSYWHVRVHQWRKKVVLRHLGNKASALRWTAPALLLSPIAWTRIASRFRASKDRKNVDRRRDSATHNPPHP